MTLGCSRVCLWADIAVFDPEQITDKATFSAPNNRHKAELRALR
jgi:N-acyl-D-aspartate/D-glutamate deacylase